MKPTALLLAAFALSGCASQVMKGYVGQPIQSVMLRYGAPVGAFDMPNGERAFQWSMTQTGVLPTNVATTGAIAPVGNAAVWASQTQIGGGQTVTNTCLYTMIGRWSEEARTWMVTGYQKPGFRCE